MKGFLYISDYVCNSTAEDRQRSTTRLVFFHGHPDGQKFSDFFLSFFLSFFYFLFFFRPNTVTAHVKGYTLILYLCNVEPCSACRGRAWRWWWISVQSHQTGSGSVGDVSIHPMDVLPKPSRLRFRVIQNVVLMPPPPPTYHCEEVLLVKKQLIIHS